MRSDHIKPLTAEEREACARLLQRIADDPGMISGDERLKALIAKIHRTGKGGERRQNADKKRAEDRALRSVTAMVQRDVRQTPFAVETLSGDDAEGERDSSIGVTHRAQRCYVCKARFADVHFFYHLLCAECARLNYGKRFQRADLRNRIAVVTGGRIKIGYQVVLRLLRDGARVLVTTRFPADAERRFSGEADFAQWKDRLILHGLDLRNLSDVEAFARFVLHNEAHVDILINNAAQTVKRPLAFYQTLLDGEKRVTAPLLLEARSGYPAPPLSLGNVDALAAASTWFPAGATDADGQQLDLRPQNSWTLRMGEIGTLEMVEAQLVNAVAPFVLCGALRPAMTRSPQPRRFIVNVSAMEGQFAREAKTDRHPHTNMAKAALNMLTRTAAADYARDQIFMNSVDTGWVTDEKPFLEQNRVRQEADFHAPLDSIDGAARVYDPIARGVNAADAPPLWGHFLKDYAPYPW